MIEDAGNSIVPSCGGALAWMAPELLDPEAYGISFSKPTRASDIYAFGCVSVEVSPNASMISVSKPPNLTDLVVVVLLPAPFRWSEGRSDHS